MLKKTDFEAFLAQLVKDDHLIGQAMNYALLAPGKRIRPLLLLNLLEDLKVDHQRGFSCASAIEMIHAYSLIHDDLPAMDNDDLRRGRPTVHRQYDEATAILAGDALLTEAFRVIAEADYNDDVKSKLTGILARNAGYNGMVQGQMIDMSFSNTHVSLEQLKEMEILKTGKLLAAPLMCACVIAGRDESVSKFEDIGYKLGLAFQIQDDVLDYTSDKMGKSTSDSVNNKTTFYSLLGEKKATEMYRDLYAQVINELKDYPNTQELISSITEREY